MDYNELKEITKHLKKTVQCNVCNAKFTDKNIKLLSVMNDEGIFQLTCNHCKNEIVVHVTINGGEQSEINIKQNNTAISHNDVLDIHNFLQKFTGDFNKLFKNKKKK